MINKFEYYLKIGKVKKKIPDSEEGKALLNQAKDRLEYIREKEINQKTAKFVFEDAYEAIREAAQSLMSIKGFKPYSHEATISFLREFYLKDFTEEELFSFDHFRQLRNNSVYKAISVMPEDANECLAFARVFVKKVEQL